MKKTIEKLRSKIKSWRISRAIKVLDKYEVKYYLLPDGEIQTTVNMFVKQVEEKFKGESGEFKRAQVLRATMNTLPKASERDIAMAIEIACSVS